MSDPDYRSTLHEALAVYPDGIGLRIGAKLRGVIIPENLSGTDLVPSLLHFTRDKGYKCFLVGGTPSDIERAARWFEQNVGGWELAGFYPGYIRGSNEPEIVRRINASGADLLLIGMGTPAQDHFLKRNICNLRVPLCIGVGGLFGYWSGRLRRAPRFVRRMNLEWLWILAQQPEKLNRYTLGVMIFFAKHFMDHVRERSRKF